MDKKVNSLPIFASHIFYDYLNEDTDELKTYKDFESTQSAPTESSTDKRILLRYPEIRKLLLDKFKKVAKDQLCYDQDFEISTSWLTRTLKGGSSQFHNHKNSFYSGIYYYGDYSDKSALLELENPIRNFPDFYMVPYDNNIFNSSVWQIPPEPKKIIFFPSYLNHRITDHYDDTTRYSLAFNIVPIGKYGHTDSTYDSKWFA